MIVARGIVVVATGVAVGALAGCGGVCVFVPCDSWTQVTVVNDCAYDVETWARYAGDGPPQYEGTVIVSGASTEIGSTGSRIDVWVRRKGAETKPGAIAWDSIASGDTNGTGDFVVDIVGDRCPA